MIVEEEVPSLVALACQAVWQHGVNVERLLLPHEVKSLIQRRPILFTATFSQPHVLLAPLDTYLRTPEPGSGVTNLLSEDPNLRYLGPSDKQVQTCCMFPNNRWVAVMFENSFTVYDVRTRGELYHFPRGHHPQITPRWSVLALNNDVVITSVRKCVVGGEVALAAAWRLKDMSLAQLYTAPSSIFRPYCVARLEFLAPQRDVLLISTRPASYLFDVYNGQAITPTTPHPVPVRGFRAVEYPTGTLLGEHVVWAGNLITGERDCDPIKLPFSTFTHAWMSHSRVVLGGFLLEVAVYDHRSHTVLLQFEAPLPLYKADQFMAETFEVVHQVSVLSPRFIACCVHTPGRFGMIHIFDLKHERLFRSLRGGFRHGVLTPPLLTDSLV